MVCGLGHFGSALQLIVWRCTHGLLQLVYIYTHNVIIKNMCQSQSLPPLTDVDSHIVDIMVHVVIFTTGFEN